MSHPSEDIVGAGTVSEETVAGKRTRGGRFLGGLLLTLLLGLMALLVLPWLDLLGGNVIPVLQALTPWWILLTLLVALAGLFTRRRLVGLAVVPALIAAGAAGWLLLDRPGVPESTYQADKTRHLRVLTLNAQVGGADVDDVMALVRRHDPDVVVFVEMTAAKLAALDAAGLSRVVPHHSDGMVDDGARGSVVLSRFPVTTLDANSNLGPHDLQSPVVRIAAPGADVTVHAVHTYPPIRDGVASWRPQLERLGAWQKANHDEHLIMTGDFNAGVVHPAFRDAARGLVDAYPSLHGSLKPSWPQHSAMPPFTQIDHMLTRGFVPMSAGIQTVGHTDHAALWADLSY